MNDLVEVEPIPVAVTPPAPTTIIRPLGDRILIREAPDVEKIGRIYTPANAQHVHNEGTVVAVGEGRLLPSGAVKAFDVLPGALVFYRSHAGEAVSHNGEKLLLMRMDDLLAEIIPLQAEA